MTDFLEVDGVRLEYRRIGGGDADRPVIVLLHEGLGCVDTWRTFPQDLSNATGHPVFVYSRHGYGRSDSKPVPWSLRYMHDEGLVVLPKVLAAAGLNDVILAGHSDGASIALIYAGGVRDHCARTLVLMAPHVFNEPVCVASIEQARDSFIEKDLRDRLQRHHGDNVDHAFWGWNRVWLDPGFRNWNIEQYLSEVYVPVLLIQGDQDQYGTVGQIEAIERQVGGFVDRALIDDCTHRLHKDQPGAVLTHIAQFLDGQA